MSESLFDIFGDHLTRQAVKNVARQPLCNIENMGKTISSGPVKPMEPTKKGGEVKKSFLCNKGTTLPSTPMQRALSPKNRNLLSAQKMISTNIIYSDADKEDQFLEEVEFTKPNFKYDNFHTDMFDYLTLPGDMIYDDPLPPTPPPHVKLSSYDCSFNHSYGDDFFTERSSDSILYIEDDLPDLY